jgi:hypothetical protein
LNLNFRSQRVWLTKVRFEFLPQEELRQRLGIPIRLWDILKHFEKKFVKTVCSGITKKYLQIEHSGLLHSSTVRDKNAMLRGGGGKPSEDANEDEQDEDELRAEVMTDALDTGESLGEKMLSKMNDELEYVGEEQEKHEIDTESEKSDSDEGIENDEEDDDEDEKNTKEVKVKKSSSDLLLLTNGKDKSDSSKKKEAKKLVMDHVNEVLALDKNLIVDYNFDSEHLQWCEITFKVINSFFFAR